MRMAILSVWLLLAGADLARAQAGAGYEALIRDGVREYNMGNYAEARLLFSKAHALRPSARTLRGMGLSDFELKRYTSAIDELSGALAAKDRPLTAEHRALVTTALQRASEYAARYTLVVPQGATRIEVDGKVHSLPESMELLLDPGRHRLAVSGPGGDRIVREVDAELGARGRIVFAPGRGAGLLPAQPATEAAAARDEGATDGAGEAASERTFTWIAAGATGVFATGMLVFGLLAGDRHDRFQELDARCPDERDCDVAAIEAAREDGQRFQTLTNVSIALTGVAAASAVTLFFLEPDAGGEQLAVGVAPGAAVLSGRF